MNTGIKLTIAASLVAISYSATAGWNGNDAGYLAGAAPMSDEQMKIMAEYRARAIEAQRQAAEYFAVHRAAAYRARMEAERRFADQLAGNSPAPRAMPAELRAPVFYGYETFVEDMEARREAQLKAIAVRRAAMVRAMEERRAVMANDSKNI